MCSRDCRWCRPERVCMLYRLHHNDGTGIISWARVGTCSDVLRTAVYSLPSAVLTLTTHTLFVYLSCMLSYSILVPPALPLMQGIHNLKVCHGATVVKQKLADRHAPDSGSA